jgi:hypothetical protein
MMERFFEAGYNLSRKLRSAAAAVDRKLNPPNAVGCRVESKEIMSTETDFLKLYHLSRPAPVQRLRETRNLRRRQALARVLAQHYTIDKEIDVDLASPLIEMKARAAYGIPWVPGCMQDNVAHPSGPPPPGSIPVSVNPADYPPLSPARSFGMQDYFRVYFAVGDLGLAIQNPDRLMLIGVDAEEASVDDLIEWGRTSPVFEGALLHFGLAIYVPGLGKTRIFDVEEMAPAVSGLATLTEYINEYVQRPTFPT